MKILNRRYITLLFTVIMIIATSCKKSFLDVQPKGFLIAKATADYDQLLNTTIISTSSSAPAFLGDDVAAIQDFLSGVDPDRQQQFKYADNILLPGELPEITYLQQNYVYNKIINEVMNSTGGTDAQKNQLMAEAKFGRAMVHLLFVSDFGKPYTAATAGTDLGVPIITAADVTKTDFKRATVQEVYDFIIKDLTDAIPNLTKPFYSNGRASKPAAEGLMARVYLYMHNYTESLKYANDAFADIASATSPIALYDYNVTLSSKPKGTWYPITAFGPSMPTLFTSQEGIYSVTRFILNINSTNAFVTTPATAKLYNPQDFRLLVLANTELFSPVVYPNGMERFPEFSAEIGISLPDLYLMRAEDKARTGDLAGAVEDVEALRIKRMPPSVAAVPAATAQDQNSLVRFILDERIREFALKGMRWWDMRRLSVDPTFGNTINYTHVVYTADGDSVGSYKLTPNRFTLKFGDKLLSQNPLLVENP